MSPHHVVAIVQSLNRTGLFATPWTAACQASLSLTISQNLLKLKSIESVILSNHLILCHPLLLLPQSSPASGSFPISWPFASGSQSTGASASASVQWIFRVDFLYDWLVWSPCCSRDSQESSLAPQFESINSSALSLLFGPTLLSVHDYWKNHSSDYTDLCWK